jgi:hypothetical protein
MNFEILETLRKEIPSLREEEKNELERKLLAEGFDSKKYGSLIVAKLPDGKLYLADGHNRFEICKKHNLDYTVQYKDFKDIDSVKVWMWVNQFAKRNLNDEWIAYYIGKLYKAEKKESRGGGDRKSETYKNQSGQNVHFDQEKTSEKLAEEKGMSEKTVRRNESFSENVDKIVEETGIDKSVILDGKLSKEDINTLSKQETEKQKEIIEKVTSGEVKTVKDAIKEQKKEEKEKFKEESQRLEDIKLREKNIELVEGLYSIGKHFLYFGNSTDEKFINLCKDKKPTFTFADPPYNAGVDEWDQDFKWEHDFLTDVSKYVAITPGHWNLDKFFQNTKMPYKWSFACFIKNGMTKGRMGFGNWIYTALFSKEESIHRNCQDYIEITIKLSETDDTSYKGRKPYEFVGHLIKLYSNEKDFVLDPFLGSGTTMIMSEKLNRLCIGAEIQKKQCEEIVKRMLTIDGNISVKRI